jgi:hypothetical protein
MYPNGESPDRESVERLEGDVTGDQALLAVGGRQDPDPLSAGEEPEEGAKLQDVEDQK